MKEADKASLVFVKHLILIILNVTKLEQCSFKYLCIFCRKMTYILVENVNNWQVLCKLFLISECSAWSANLRRQLYRKGIRLQQRAQTIHANYDQHRPITWGKPQELFQFVKTSEYLQLENINSEACEQTNLALKRITSSTTFMSPSMYMRSLTLFMADINITANKFKEQ